MKVKGKYSESDVLHAIILIVAAVLAIIVFVVVLLLTGGGFGKPADEKPDVSQNTTTSQTKPEKEQGFVPGDDLMNEMMDAAAKLIENNYYVLCLYYIDHLSFKEEPYGNKPEDGYLTVVSDRYTAMDQIEELVNGTYTADTAQKVMTNSLGYGALYKTRNNGALGIIENVEVYRPYTISWESPRFVPHPVSETECDLAITVHDNGAEVQISGKMTKTSDGWRLTDVIFLPE